MEEVTLFIRDGSEEVTTLEIPVFDPRTDCIQWGSRFFAYRELDDKYCEIMVYVVPPEKKKSK